jgi:menaquinone reductase, multiheme cytochrome c subunit
MPQIFPQNTNLLVRVGLGAVLLGLVGGAGVFAYFAQPEVSDTGYEPTQPVPYSHKLHVGNLGMDCLYCHYTVEKASYAAIPSAGVCMNCHVRVRPDSAVLAPIREAYANAARPVEWIKIHRLPDYVYFNHKAHVTAGVSCVSCHGRVDQMVVVKQEEPLSMAWCLECHRNPAPNVRPVELVTRLDWQAPGDPAEIGRELIAAKNIQPPVNCAGCHR